VVVKVMMKMGGESLKNKKNIIGEGEKTEEVGSKYGAERGDCGARFEVDCKPSSSIFENGSAQWLTTKEAAAYLRISPKYLLNLTSNGRVRYYKLGRSNRFLMSELSQLLLAQPRGGLYGN
jgi:excisionase family DNA binding protein